VSAIPRRAYCTFHSRSNSITIISLAAPPRVVVSVNHEVASTPPSTELQIASIRHFVTFHFPPAVLNTSKHIPCLHPPLPSHHLMIITRNHQPFNLRKGDTHARLACLARRAPLVEDRTASKRPSRSFPRPSSGVPVPHRSVTARSMHTSRRLPCPAIPSLGMP
jgi:hypothetical protein